MSPKPIKNVCGKPLTIRIKQNALRAGRENASGHSPRNPIKIQLPLICPLDRAKKRKAPRVQRAGTIAIRIVFDGVFLIWASAYSNPLYKRYSSRGETNKSGLAAKKRRRVSGFVSVSILDRVLSVCGR